MVIRLNIKATVLKDMNQNYIQLKMRKKKVKEPKKNKTGFYKPAIKMNYIRDIFTNILY